MSKGLKGKANVNYQLFCGQQIIKQKLLDKVTKDLVKYIFFLVHLDGQWPRWFLSNVIKTTREPVFKDLKLALLWGLQIIILRLCQDSFVYIYMNYELRNNLSTFKSFSSDAAIHVRVDIYQWHLYVSIQTYWTFE